MGQVRGVPQHDSPGDAEGRLAANDAVKKPGLLSSVAV